MAETPKSSFPRKRLLIPAVLVIAAAAGGALLWGRFRPGLTSPSTPIPLASGSGTSVRISGGTGMQSSSQMSVHLSEGQSQPETVELAPQAVGAPLSPDEVEAILARLPAMPAEEGDETDFKIAQQPIPPPRPGVTIPEPFPAAGDVAPPTGVVTGTTETGPLEVLRFAPEGEIPLAPFASVTFNQPMVALDTVESLSAGDVPVIMEPALPGTWRWLGAKTLTFQYDSTQIDRLPKATQYRMTVPAGTRSAAGGVLAQAVEWSFSTPPLKMAMSYPYDTPQPLDPVFFIVFDQRIDPAAVLAKISVTANGDAVELVLASESDWQKDKEVTRLVKDSLEGRWLAFKAAEPLPAAASVNVTVQAGAPSAEGPLLSQEAQSYSFQTYTPLRIEESGCSYYDNVCRPLTPFFIRFNNPIDMEAYKDTWLSVEPAIPGVSVNIYGNTIQINGATKGQTTYSILVSKDVQDIFGQTLGKDETLKIKVDTAEPLLAGPEQPFVTIDPSARKPVFSVYVINYTSLDVTIYAVQPSDWQPFKNYMRNRQLSDQKPVLPGRLVYQETMRLETPTDVLTQVDIDLSEHMDGASGQFIVMIEPPASLLANKEERFWRTIHAWVQVTQIGLDAFTDHSEMVVWTTALQDGAPLADVTIQAGSGAALATTGADGTARFAIPSSATYLVAKLGADQAMLPRGSYFWDDSGWPQYPVTDMLRWYVFDDRQMYKPGEEVHLKGWLRRIGGKQNGDVSLPGAALTSVSYRLVGPQGNDLGSGQAPVNALGGFDLVLTLPQNVNLGMAYLEFTAPGLSGLDSYQFTHTFQIQEFRRPEFEVIARAETPGPYFAGDTATLAVDAKYYAGGPLPNAEVTWQVTSTPGSYSPPDWPDFTFGTWQPWWWAYDFYRGGFPFEGSGGTTEVFSGITDAAGAHYLALQFDTDGGPRPHSVQASATVMDVNRQAWSSTASLLVHPAELYVGLRSERYFVERGTPLKVDFIVVDLDGKPVEDRPVEVRAARLEWKYKNGEWGEEEVDVQKCNLGSQTEPGTCTFETPLGGSYRITAEVTDSMGRLNQSQFTRWVSGGQLPPKRNVEKEEATLIPDKESYQPGDVAQILVQSPFAPAEGLLTVSRSGLLYTQRFAVEDGSATLEIPILEEYIPNLNIEVDLVGSAPRVDDQGNPVADAPKRPAYASGQLNLRIPPLQRTLSLQVSAEPNALEPGGETTISVVVRDAAGSPVPGAEIAVVVVDEAILALTSYQLADPISAFYFDRPSYFDAVYGRASIVLVDPRSLAGREETATLQAVTMEKEVMRAAAPQEAPMPAMAMPTATASMADMAGNAQQPQITVRTDFNPLAAFVPAATTDANGSASLPVKLPDNLTRYRIMVAAVEDGRRFGMGDSNLTARLPLMVRPSAPRFLNFGDIFELPVVLQNQTDQPMEVDVVVRASNLALLSGSQPDQAGVRVTVPANDRVEVRFPAAAQSAGTARLQIAAVSGSYADAANVSLPVYTPATTEAFATYGVLDEGVVAQPVASPVGVYAQFGGLEINTSSTALQALTDAVLYLVAYPFECAEQLSSRILAIAALRDVLTAFEAEGLPSPQEMEAAVNRDIARLQGLQNADGGFPYWYRGFESIPFNTIHVTHALYRAQQKGFSVPADTQSRALEYLRQIENYYPSWYSQHTRWTLSSYALFVRNLMGDRDPQKALKIINEAGLEQLRLETIGWLWPVLQDAPEASSQLEAIRKHIANRVVETPGAANFTTDYDEQTYLLLSSNRRTDAILLDALILDNPQSDLIPKLVNGLLAHRIKGRWGNTQENIFVLLALDRYFNTFEAQTPDFVAQLWLGETYAGSHTYQGRTTERHETVIPMVYLVDETLGGGQTQNLVLSKDGAGRLYYRLGLRYAPTDLNLKPLDMGFVVERRYEALDDPADVSRDSDGVWHIQAGARVRVRLTMVADNRRYHVALVDPLPAGLEIVNPALAVSGPTPQDPGSSSARYGWWWWGTWYEHQNLRDERAEAFTSLLWDGVYEYTYIARATTHGTFIAPPAKAEEMYSPEVFGRSASDWVIVEEK